MDSITVEIIANPERVWAVIGQVEEWPLWTPSIQNVTRLESGPLVVGSQILIRQPKFPPAVWKLAALEPLKKYSWRTGFPGMVVIAEQSVVSVLGGSVVTLSLGYQGLLGKMLERLTRGLNRQYLEYEASGLKKRCEGQARA